MEYIHHYDSPLGGITMASDGNALTGYAGGIEKKSDYWLWNKRILRSSMCKSGRRHFNRENTEEQELFLNTVQKVGMPSAIVEKDSFLIFENLSLFKY